MRILRSIGGVSAAVMASASLSQARIGESKAECEARYGEAVATQAPKLEKSDPDADVFEVSGIRIVVEYRAGEAWLVTYADRKMTQTNADKILANYSEATGAKWEGPSRFAGVKHWNDSKGGRHAVLYESPLYQLVVFDKSAVDAKWNPVVFVSEATEPVETAKPEGDEPSRRKPVPVRTNPFDDL